MFCLCCCVVLDVQFSADKFTAALKKFAENDKEQMVNTFNLFLLCSLLLLLY